MRDIGLQPRFEIFFLLRCDAVYIGSYVWPLNMAPTGCLLTSVNNYQYRLLNICNFVCICEGLEFGV